MTIVNITVKVFNLLTLVGRCKGTLTVPLTHFSLPTLLWQGIQGGVSHSTPQGLLGRAVVPMGTLAALQGFPQEVQQAWWRLTVDEEGVEVTEAVAKRVDMTGALDRADTTVTVEKDEAAGRGLEATEA